MHKKLFKPLLGLLILLSLISISKAGEPFVIIQNEVSLSYTNAAQAFYYNSYDSAQIYVYYGPVMSIKKTTKNLRTAAEGSNTQAIDVAPGDTVEIYLNAQNTGDTTSHIVEITDTFPSTVGGPTSNSMSYVVGSETCAINGSLVADSISWSVDASHSWNAWQNYNGASIPTTCTGIRWRWNYVVNNVASDTQSWIRIKYQWKRNQN